MALSKVCVVVGVGPGIGGAVAKKFASKGYKVALISRGLDKLKLIKEQIQNDGGNAIAVVADATDENSVRSAFKEIRDQIGHPEVLVYNAGARRLRLQGIVETSVDEFVGFWKVKSLKRVVVDFVCLFVRSFVCLVLVGVAFELFYM